MDGAPLRSIAAVALAAASLAACGAPRSPTTLPVGPMALALADPGTMTVGELRQRLMAFSDLAMGEMARASSTALLSDSTAATRAFVQLLQAQVAATSLALAVEPDPETALQDLMVSVAVERAALGAGAPPAMNPAARALLDTTLGRLEQEIWTLGERTYAAGELSTLRARVKTWQDAGSGSSPAGLVRVTDLPPAPGPGMSKGLFAPLDEANRQLEESRLLGERFLFLAERLPVITLWQAEAVTWEVLAAPESRRTLDGLTTMSATLERLALRVDSLPVLLDGQRDALFAAFDAREATARTLMADAGTMMAEASALIEGGEQATASLAAALASAERTVAALRDDSAPGGAVSFDIASYEQALADFRSATEALDAALARAEGLAAAPRGVVDHVAWRAAQLLVLLFVLVAAYKVLSVRLDRRSEP
ncbi:MAG: hypothetical protein AB7T31_14405 [Gemmatimonadales bacterium]